MENLSLVTGSKSKYELLELKKLHENIKNLIENDFSHVSDLYCSNIFQSINGMEQLIQIDLEIFNSINSKNL